MVTLVNVAGLTDLLTNDGPFTVFAPNNATFYKLMDESLINAQDLIDLPSVKDVLEYHLLNGYMLASDLPNDADTETVYGQNVNINADFNGLSVSHHSSSDDNYYGDYNGFDICCISLIDGQNDK